MLFTYGDVVRRSRALLDDQDAQVFNDTFLLEFVNNSINTISSALMTNSARLALFRTPAPMLVPAGSTSINRTTDRVQIMNLKNDANEFQGTTGQWTFNYTPTFTTGQTDPLGGSTATLMTWATGGAPFSQVENMYAPTSIEWTSSYISVTAGIWVKTTGITPLEVKLSVGSTDSGAFTEQSYKHFTIDNTWRRISHTCNTFYTSTGANPALKLEFSQHDYTEPTDRKICVWNAFITDRPFDLGTDLVTVGLPIVTLGNAKDTTSLSAPLVMSLPTNYIAAQQLWEKGVGDSDYQYQPMYGPALVPSAVQGPFLRWWDTREGEINFLGATTDRLVRMDYWGDLGSFARATDGDVVNAEEAFPLADVSAFEAAAHLVAYFATRAKGSVEQADRFASLTEEGVGGAAGFFVTNLINSQIKMKQSVAQRRQPYFGVRYPGLTDRVLGGY